MEYLAAERAGVLTDCYNLLLIRRLTDEIEHARKPLDFTYKRNRQEKDGSSNAK